MGLIVALLMLAGPVPCEQVHGHMEGDHCRVQAVLTPTPDSHIEMEVWLPTNWNGKFVAVGNGGWAGSISTAAMKAAVEQGYATASTDTGHKSAETPGGSFALGHPEKLIDYGYRAVHEMTERAKSVIASYYGKPPSMSYWNSCSNGGRQGLMEAQRYPADFDGIVAGAPAANWTGRAIASMWVGGASHKNEASYIPASKYPALHDFALKTCHAVDGVIENPATCKVDPDVLLCKNGDAADCLTSAQVETARAVYASTALYPGLAPGSELGWATYAGPKPFSIGLDHFRYVVFKDAQWNPQSLDAAVDLARAAKVDADIVNALNPNLQPFFARGGKLIQYHGWADPQIPPMHSVDYYNSVIAKLGSKVDTSYRLFMVPGMGHCGPDKVDALPALERWREQGVAPERIETSRDGKTRAVCSWSNSKCKVNQ